MAQRMTQRYRAITPDSPDWPTALDVLDDTPDQLWVAGDANLAQVTGRAVAVVGSRAATSYGTMVAGDLGFEFGQNAVTVVSGLAYGIDGAAHKGAVTAQGVTVAVLPCGLDMVYPQAHAQLAAAIVDEGGALVSECPPGSAPSRDRFLARNRIVAALSNAVVVVEGGVRSGSMATVRRAQMLGRPVFAVPGPITSAQSTVPNDLIAKGYAKAITRAQDVLDSGTHRMRPLRRA